MENETFRIEYGHTILAVDLMNLPGQVLFNIVYPESKLPLVICRATNFNGVKFWTSVPEGRQSEAIKIGPYIEQYFRAKQQ